MQNLTFYIRYQDNNAVPVETLYTSAGDNRNRPLETVGHLVAAYKTAVAPRFSATPLDDLILYKVENGEEVPLTPGVLLATLTNFGREDFKPLIINRKQTGITEVRLMFGDANNLETSS